MLGIPSSDLTRLRWRSDFASESPEPSPIGSEARRSGFRARGSRQVRDSSGSRSRSAATRSTSPPTSALRTADSSSSTSASRANTGKPVVARAPIPPAGRGGLLVGLVVEFSRAEAFTAAHRETGKAPTFAVFRAGVLRLRRPEVVRGRGHAGVAGRLPRLGRPQGDEGAGRNCRIARAALPADPGSGLPVAACAADRRRPGSGHRLTVARARGRGRHAPTLRRLRDGQRPHRRHRAPLSDHLGRLRGLRPLAARDVAQRVGSRVRDRRRGVGLRQARPLAATGPEPAHSRSHHLAPRGRAGAPIRSAGARLAARARRGRAPRARALAGRPRSRPSPSSSATRPASSSISRPRAWARPRSGTRSGCAREPSCSRGSSAASCSARCSRWPS